MKHAAKAQTPVCPPVATPEEGEAVAIMRAALTKIAGRHYEQIGHCWTDIDEVPDLTAEEASNHHMIFGNCAPGSPVWVVAAPLVQSP